MQPTLQPASLLCGISQKLMVGVPAMLPTAHQCSTRHRNLAGLHCTCRLCCPQRTSPALGTAIWQRLTLHLQGGWERHQSLAPVLIQGSWALLTCKCRSAGPSGGSDRLCLVKLPTGASEQVRALRHQMNSGRLCLVKLPTASSEQVRVLLQ